MLFCSDTSLLLVSEKALAGCFASPSVQSGPPCPCRIFAFKVLMSVLPPHSGLFNECLVIFIFIFFPLVAIIQQPFLLEKFAVLLFVVQLAAAASQLDGTIVLKFHLKFWPAGCKWLRGSVPVHVCYISPISCIKPFHIYDPRTSLRHAHDVKKIERREQIEGEKAWTGAWRAFMIHDASLSRNAGLFQTHISCQVVLVEEMSCN